MSDIVKIKINDIDPFKNHPYKVENNESLIQLQESIKTNGLLNPIIVRKKDNGKYEMISGHRRMRALELNGETEINAYIKELNDDEATIFMVDSNLQREKILPSEKAFAYKMRLEAINNLCHYGTKVDSAQKLAKSTDDSRRQIYRYIRLTHLIPELLKIVDNTYEKNDKHSITMGLLPAVELSYLNKDEQMLVYSEMKYDDASPSHSQAIRIRKLSEKKKLPYEIDFILDEFANCPPLADIEAIVSVARSRGMHFHFFIQSFSQLDNVYGKEVAQIILDNCGLIYLKTNTQDTAEAISKRLGKKTIESNSVRQSMSLLNYNGDRSTNLIGRDLMTPEEVKQLHYKTIIFPIIGFPIFRDTVLYNKFSCYKSGIVERKSKPLKDLAYTYFTVENIEYQISTGRMKESKEAKEYYEALELSDKENLRPLELIIEKIFKQDYDIKYKIEANHRVHISVRINHPLKQVEKSLLANKIKPELYHLEISEKEEKTIVNIYNENPLKDLSLRK